MSIVELTGQKFGRLTVLKKTAMRSGSKVVWLCHCDCGGEIFVNGTSLRTGATKSCGCFRKEVVGRIHRTHGFSKLTEFKSWYQAQHRCYTKDNPAYKHYGGRGIRMCARWKSSFQKFLNDMGPCPLGLTLERINNDGNYEPKNCKWATRSEQNKNRRKLKVA